MSEESTTLQNPLEQLFKSRKYVILDGALATELEARGCSLDDKIWSAKILISHPQLIQQVHVDYFLAGADVAITASYQAAYKGLSETLGFTDTQCHDLVVESVRLAQAARADVNKVQPTRRMLVAGSVGPYGAYLADGSEYRGDYSLTSEDFRSFHRGRIAALVSAGVDLLALETIPSFPETKALLQLVEDDFPDIAVWCSFTLKDESHISDGTLFAELCNVLNRFDQVVAVGINCVEQALVSPALQELHNLTPKRLLAYPNSGEVYDAVQKTWHPGSIKSSDMRDRLKDWTNAGASLLGGCCRTGPADIESIHTTLSSFD